MTSSKRSAAIYCRISLDVEGEALGVARQEEDARALAERDGLQVIDVYADNDKGASTRSRTKIRPEYQRMLEDARAGRFHVILAYSNSRLTRRPLEFEELIKLHEDHGTIIRTVVSGEDDLSTADGRMIARIKASIDAGEAERTAERVTRRHLQAAQAGIPVGGWRPFGWQADKITLDPVESAAIRAGVKEILSGMSPTLVARQWNEQGLTTTRGNRWVGGAVKQMLKSPRIAGWRVYREEIAVDKQGQPVKGIYAPVLDDETWRAVVAAMEKPEKRSRVPRKGARHYLLTGMLRCGICNGPMYGGKVPQYDHVYRCDSKTERTNAAPHGNSVMGLPLEAFVTDLVLTRLAQETVDRPPAVFDGEGRLAEVGAQVDELMGAFVAGKLSGAVVFPAVEKLEAERDRLQHQRAQVAALNMAPDLAKIDRAAWDAMDTDHRRAVVEVVLEVIMIRPAAKLGNKFDFNRVVPVWKGQP